MADGTSETTRQIAFAASFTSQILKTYVEGYAAHLGLPPFLIETAEFNQVVSVATSFDVTFDTDQTMAACFLFRLEDLAASGRAQDCSRCLYQLFQASSRAVSRLFQRPINPVFTAAPAFCGNCGRRIGWVPGQSGNLARSLSRARTFGTNV